ncbi:hypothetical protein [Nostoc sp. KVJ20]|uniref:hypothetical protein n=1 Tax=Nostoc sp. KVJ20 TaxID=457944 RepID=UPI00159EFA2F|nr:hypothetical protein [Nostoc sp. KVJ20]
MIVGDDGTFISTPKCWAKMVVLSAKTLHQPKRQPAIFEQIDAMLMRQQEM